jgi:phosphoribosylanthranilate isomerase
MAAPKIKICGISTLPTLDAVIAAGADYCGFVFFPPSPRNISLGQLAELAARGGNRIARVGLFVDPDDAQLAGAIEAGRLDAVQLHGKESPERAAQVKARFGLPVWKALPVSAREDVERASAYSAAADLLLFDAKTPKGALPGGMGLTFDWSLLGAYKGPLPWGLAGGLTPGNVAEAVAQTRPPLVDTSSGVESAPGIKDVDKIAAFCKAARQP